MNINEKEFREIYISVDIEANGGIPGAYSMSSMGAFVAGGLTKTGEYVSFDHTDKSNVFYTELKPISDNFDADAINVGLLEGFDNSIPDPTGQRHFNWTVEYGEEPKIAMKNFAEWVNEKKSEYNARPIFMAYPASFDWMFVYWYFRYCEVESPFGFSGVLDLKTLFSTKNNNKGIGRSTKRNMPKSLFPKDIPHTHKADDDAIEQGIMGMNMLRYRQSNS